MRLGLDLSLKGYRVGGPVSAIQSFEVVNATGLDATGDYSDATVRIGVNGTGWVVKATMPYLVGQTFDPSKISIAVSDPGYDATTTVTRTRTIAGTVVLRRQYNAASSNQIANDGITFTVYFAVDDYIYSGTTVTSVTASSGFYGSSTAGSVASITNSSVLAYSKPLFCWVTQQQERVTADFGVEAIAIHRHAMNGQMVARMEFIAADTHSNTAATQTASTTSLSSLQTQGNIPEVFKGTVPVTALTQGDVVTVNAKVYPFIGDSTSVLDLSVDGRAWPTSYPDTPLLTKLDKTGAYGGAIACWKNGAAGGTVQTTIALARTTPYPSLSQAISALQTYNNANKTGNNTPGGSYVYGIEDSAGAGATWTSTAGGVIADIGTLNAADSWIDVYNDPNNTGSCTLSATVLGRKLPSMVRFNGMNILQGGNFYFSTGNTNANIGISSRGCAFNVTGGTSIPVFYQFGRMYQRDNTFTNVGANVTTLMLSSQSSNPRANNAGAFGIISTDATANNGVWLRTVVGCQFKRIGLIDIDPAVVPNCDFSDGAIVYNNHFMNLQAAQIVGNKIDWTRGIAIVQNVMERAVVTSSECLRIDGDGGIQNTANIILMYNTLPAGGAADGTCRINGLYTDVAGAQGITKRYSHFRANLFGNYNCKTDTFTVNTTVTGRVGNWPHRYTVGHRYNLSVQGDANAATAPTTNGSTWLGEFWHASSNPGAGFANVNFTNNQAGTTGAGNGTYTLTSGGTYAAKIIAIPTAAQALGYDISGVARKNSGACGAYEWTV